MPKFRVTYTAAKRENRHREENGVKELLDTRISFHEEKSVEVEAENEQEAIAKATKHLPEGVELSAHAAQLRPNTASGAATIPTPPPKPQPDIVEWAKPAIADDDLEDAYQRVMKKRGK